MDIKKYSQAAVDVINHANKIAIRYGNSEVTDLHLLYAILQNPNNQIEEFLKESSVNFQQLKDDVENALTRIRSAKGVSNLYVSRSYQKVLLVAEELCRNLFE